MKNKFLKAFKILGYFLIGIVITFIILVFFTGPKIPENTNAIIDQILAQDPPELVKGQSGYVISDNTKIWYESISPKDSVKGSVMLFMGIANDALGWPPAFLNGLVDAGYRLIRFDYRSTGLSDWIEDYEKNAFSLVDLGHDALCIMDTLKIEKAHLVGVSLGGMVAQDFAIHFPERSLTLSSMMSSGHIIDPELPGMSMGTLAKLIKTAIKYNIIRSDKNTIKSHIAFRTILKGESDYEIDVREVAEQVYYNISRRNGYNFDASKQHQQATFKSGSRYEALKKSEIPILILHGRQDPLMPFEHGQKLADILPKATSSWYDNMGHDIPNLHMDSVINDLIQNFQRKPF